MRLACDVDGCLADFNTAFLPLLQRVSGRSLGLALTPGQRYCPDTWAWPRALGFTAAEISRAWAEVSESDAWWADLRPLPGAETFLNTALDRAHQDDTFEIVFLTARQRQSRFVRQQTEEWLRAWLLPGMYDNVTVLVGAQHKGDLCHALGLDAILDDKPSHLTEARRACGPTMRTFLKAATYNADHKVEAEATVIHTLDEFWRYV